MSGDYSLPISFSIGKHFREFIKQQVRDGRYKTGSEVMRAGLRLLEEEEHRWKIRHLDQEQKFSIKDDADIEKRGVKKPPGKTRLKKPPP